MKDYASMSDFEINKAVFVKTQYYDEFIDKPVRDGAPVHWGDGCNWREFDPCNNPADAWPIIVENKITIDAPLPQNQYWTAEKHDLDGGLLNFHVSTNPLRCAMIVFLMMKEGE